MPQTFKIGSCIRSKKTHIEYKCTFIRVKTSGDVEYKFSSPDSEITVYESKLPILVQAFEIIQT